MDWARASYGYFALGLAVLFLAAGCRSCESTQQSAAESSDFEEGRGVETGLSLIDGPSEAELQKDEKPAGDLLAQVLAKPSLPGAPEFEKVRAIVLTRAKGEPLVFERIPQAADDTGAARHYRHQLSVTAHPWDVLQRLIPTFTERPELGRSVLLREGYLYTTDPDLAYAIVSQIGVQHLFREERVWIKRGEDVAYVQRKKGRYYYEDGPFKGEIVKLLFLDRIGVGEIPRSLHMDFRSLRYREPFDRAAVRHITETHVVADLFYGEERIESVLERNGAQLQLLFPAETELSEEQRTARELSRRKMKAASALARVVVDQVYEGLPFDEPLNEVGQQDGRLRPVWRQVYLEGRNSYRFQGDRYPVFDPQGRPLVPQVCADFLLDTFERASGTWWRPVGQAPGRTQGLLDLKREKHDLRRTVHLTEFFQKHTDWFDIRTLSPSEQIVMGEKKRFFQWVADNQDFFEPMDLVFIRGKTPWDKREDHTHTFFVLDTDPISGVPLAVAGNAARPSIWSWETEARRTPLRTVRSIVRPRLVWLETILDLDQQQTASAPPLAIESSSRPGF